MMSVCQDCGRHFADRSSLRNHIKAIHESITHSCTECSRVFSYLGQLKRHVKIVHEKIKHTCNKCGKVYLDKANLDIHLETIHEKIKHTCDDCGNEFRNKSSLRYHRLFVHEKIKHTCHDCGITFSRKYNLKTHQMSSHQKIKYPCLECGQLFSRKGNLECHQMSVHEKRKYACDHCGLNLSRKSALKRHLDVIHNVTSTLRSAINSGDAIHWAAKGQSHLLSKQVIFFNGPRLQNVLSTHFERYTVPALNGVPSTPFFRDQHAERKLEPEENSSYVLREENVVHELHKDLDATNIFQLVNHSHSTNQTAEVECPSNASSGVWSTSCFRDQHPERQLKPEENSSYVLREENIVHELHEDSDATDVFQLTNHSPSTNQTAEGECPSNASSGVRSISCFCDQHPERQLKPEEDSSYVLREENIIHELKKDSDAINAVQLVNHSPSTTNQTAEVECPSDAAPFAVQLSNCIFPLTESCWILVPKGISYKFINETSTDVILWRVRCKHNTPLS